MVGDRPRGYRRGKRRMRMHPCAGSLHALSMRACSIAALTRTLRSGSMGSTPANRRRPPLALGGNGLPPSVAKGAALGDSAPSELGERVSQGLTAPGASISPLLHEAGLRVGRRAQGGVSASSARTGERRAGRAGRRRRYPDPGLHAPHAAPATPAAVPLGAGRGRPANLEGVSIMPGVLRRRALAGLGTSAGTQLGATGSLWGMSVSRMARARPS